MKCPCDLWPLKNVTSSLTTGTVSFARQNVCNVTVVPGVYRDELIFTPTDGDFSSTIGFDQVSLGITISSIFSALIFLQKENFTS